MEEKIWTIIDLIKWGEDWLNDKGVESPRLNIELMICDILSYQRIELYTKFDQPLNKEELSILRDYVKRRASREPLQYIIGKVNFRNLVLKIDKRALIPRPETEYLIELISQKFQKDSFNSILDIGSGSGCISLSLAQEYPNSQVLGIDISKEAISLAEENKISNEIDNCSFLELDVLLDKPDGRFDLIISNPPYVSVGDFNELEPELKKHEPRIALSDEGNGLKFYKSIIEKLPELLNQKGVFAFEIGMNQEEGIIDFLSTDFNFEVLQDLDSVNRYIVGRI